MKWDVKIECGDDGGIRVSMPAEIAAQVFADAARWHSVQDREPTEMAWRDYHVEKPGGGGAWWVLWTEDGMPRLMHDDGPTLSTRTRAWWLPLKHPGWG